MAVAEVPTGFIGEAVPGGRTWGTMIWRDLASRSEELPPSCCCSGVVHHFERVGHLPPGTQR